jgi:hypothetical protein
MEEWFYRSTYSWLSILVGGEWIASRSGRFTPEEIPIYPFYRRLSGPQSQFRRCGEEKNLDSIGTRTPTPPVSVRAAASRPSSSPHSRWIWRWQVPPQGLAVCFTLLSYFTYIPSMNMGATFHSETSPDLKRTTKHCIPEDVTFKLSLFLPVRLPSIFLYFVLLAFCLFDSLPSFSLFLNFLSFTPYLYF